MGFRTGEVELAIGEVAEAYRICWKGRANGHRPANQFSEVFERLLEAEKRIEFDMSGLEHISSATLVVIMRFMKQAHERGLDVELTYDDSVSWQCMTFEPLRRVSNARRVAQTQLPLAPVEWASSPEQAQGWS